MEATEAPANAATRTALILATGLGVDGEHGPLFRDVDLEIGPGLHAVQMPAGPEQAALLLTLAGRLKPSHGTVVVMGETAPRRIRKKCAIAAFEGIDELDEPVTVQTVLAEQCRWLAPWYSMLPNTSGRAEFDRVFGDRPAPDPHTRIVELSDLDLFLLRITLALLSNRPILVVGDLEQVRYLPDRDIAIARLHSISDLYTVIVGVTNPLGEDSAPGHQLHDHRPRIGKD
jgi:hypothetical protein